MNPPPPMPQDCGRATPKAKVAATAASTALPPPSSTSRPIREASGDSEATTPPSLRTASRNFEPSSPEAREEATRTNTTTSTSGTAGRTRYTLLPPSNRSGRATSPLGRPTRRAPIEGTALKNVRQGNHLEEPRVPGAPVGQGLEAYAMDQRVGMPMHLP